MKKLTLIACLSTVLLAPLTAEAGWEKNWLVGISGAYNWHVGDLGISVDNIGVGSHQFHNNFDTTRPSWGILAGYQAQCNRWLIGGELNIDWENEAQTQSYSWADPTVGAFRASVTGNYKRDTTVGLTGRIGYEITCWLLPYVRAGVETSSDSFDIAIGNSTSYYSNSVSERSYRFIGGVGLEMPIPMLSCLTFRAEYNYHSKGQTLGTNGLWLTNGAPNPSFSAASHYHNHTNSAKIALVYNFA